MIAVVILTPILTGLIISFVLNTAEKDSKKESCKYSEQYFVMQPSRTIMRMVKPYCYITNIVFTLLFAVAILIEPVIAIFTPLLIIALYSFTKLMIGCSKYSLVIDGDLIIYRGIWKSKKKTFEFRDIDYFVMKTLQQYGITNLFAYSKDNKKMFAVGGTLSCYEIFLKVIDEHKIEIRTEKKHN